MQRRLCADLWRQCVEDWYLTVAVDDIVKLGDPSTPWERRALEAARKFHVEYALVGHTVRLNEQRGVAPSTEELRKMAQTVWRGHMKYVDLASPVPAACLYSQRFAVWACRWRRRWGGRLGALRTREDLPVSVRREKAGSRECILLLF